ncbi:MAG: hypothetical protein ACLR0U_06650 [Enterocloster clostridioformis]
MVLTQQMLFKSIDNHSGIKCIIDFPAYDTAAVPVDYSESDTEIRV